MSLPMKADPPEPRERWDFSLVPGGPLFQLMLWLGLVRL